MGTYLLYAKESTIRQGSDVIMMGLHTRVRKEGVGGLVVLSIELVSVAILVPVSVESLGSIVVLVHFLGFYY